MALRIVLLKYQTIDLMPISVTLVCISLSCFFAAIMSNVTNCSVFGLSLPESFLFDFFEGFF